MNREKTAFSILPAYHGDCILLRTFTNNNTEFVILIDGGTAQTFKYSLKKGLETIAHIDIVVLTHIDSDHIAGLINFFKSSLTDKITIGEIWMNRPDLVDIESGGMISVGQADTLTTLLNNKYPDITIKSVHSEMPDIEVNGIKFEFLSPTPQILEELYNQWQSERMAARKSVLKDIATADLRYSISLESLSKLPFTPQKKMDKDIYNASSISFILTCPDISMLLLADSRAEVITEQLIRRGFCTAKPLIVDYVKISHHGSLNNTSACLLELINCDNYIISTNGGSADHIHPSRETLARIIYNHNRTEKELRIFFNYDLDILKERIGDFITETDLQTGNWNAVFRNNFIEHDI